jgi:hypothetical protein
MAACPAYIMAEAFRQSHYLYNGSGADLAQGSLSVLGRMVVIADEAVASTASGAFSSGDGLEIQCSTLTNGEKTFATKNQNVYFNPTGKSLSDTETVGYYLIGQLKTAINAAGMIEVILRKWAVLIETDET